MTFEPEQYDSWYDRHATLFHAELKAVELAYTTCPAPSLEVGVGTGRFASELGIDYGIDPDKNMLALARMRGVRVMQGIGESLPFSDSYFGAVLFITSLPFLNDAQRSMNEASRVLKLEGCLIIAFVPKNSHFGRKYESLAKQGDERFRGAKFLTYFEVSKLVPKQFKFTSAYSTLIGEKQDTNVYHGVMSNASFIVLKYKKSMGK